MSTACRHCIPDAPPDGSNLWPGEMTYLTSLSCGSFENLHKHMVHIEQNVGVIYGVSTWCEKCRQCSILSYTLYVHLSKQNRCQEPLKNRLDYYVHMCNLAEKLTGQRGVGFSAE